LLALILEMEPIESVCVRLQIERVVASGAGIGSECLIVRVA